jgi:membrane-bound metal-dependent hydrolase YbcI (DUF457 family)
MTGATHVAIAVCCGIVAGVPTHALALLAGGALAPDIDHPKSTIGRVFFPISIPLAEHFGHRGPLHSFWLWGSVAVASLLWKPALLIGIGGILHIVADCATVSGVRAMAPFSNKLFVLFKREWRIKTGSTAEFAILAVFGSVAWGGSQISSAGGISALMGYLTGSPKIMLEEYLLKGSEKCYVSGSIRWNSGEIEEGQWLIVGSESKSKLAIIDRGKLVRIPERGYFTKARLRPSGQKWVTMKLNGIGITSSTCYFFSGGKWHQALPGSTVFGELIGDKLDISPSQ